MKHNVLIRRNFSSQEILEMAHLMKTEKKTALERKYHAVYLHMIGKTNVEIAEALALCKQTVGTYLHDYYDHGIDGLVPVKQSGRPPKMSIEQKEELYQVMTEKTPHDVGFEHAYNWTAALAIQWVKKTFDITYQHSQMQVILHQMGLSYTRPTYTLAKADKQKQHAFVEDLNGVKKTDFFR